MPFPIVLHVSDTNPPQLDKPDPTAEKQLSIEFPIV
jgi:hypothetical protein